MARTPSAESTGKLIPADLTSALAGELEICDLNGVANSPLLSFFKFVIVVIRYVGFWDWWTTDTRIHQPAGLALHSHPTISKSYSTRFPFCIHTEWTLN
jgi:hypothetical protein